MSLAGTAYAWATVGIARMASVYTAWLGLIVLGLWATTVVLTWTGNPAARILVLAGIAWTAINVFMSMAALLTIGRGSLMGQMFWVILGLRLVAAYLLFRNESTAWSRAQRAVPVTAPPP